MENSFLDPKRNELGINYTGVLKFYKSLQLKSHGIHTERIETEI